MKHSASSRLSALAGRLILAAYPESQELSAIVSEVREMEASLGLDTRDAATPQGCLIYVAFPDQRGAKNQGQNTQ